MHDADLYDRMISHCQRNIDSCETNLGWRQHMLDELQEGIDRLKIEMRNEEAELQSWQKLRDNLPKVTR